MSVVKMFRLSGTSTMPALLASDGRPAFSGFWSTATDPFCDARRPAIGEEQRRLARAVRAEEGLDPAGLDREVDVAERGGLAVAAGEPGALEPGRHAVTAAEPCTVPRYASTTARSARIVAGGPSAITDPKSST